MKERIKQTIMIVLFFGICLGLNNYTLAEKEVLSEVERSIENNVKVHQCLKVVSPPVIDGKLNDACWLKAKRITDFVPIGISRKDLSPEQTTAYLVYDDNNLYLGFKCLSNSEEIVAFCKERDVSKLFQDDIIEVFINPDPKNIEGYYHFSASSIGTQHDEICKMNISGADPMWDADWKAVAAKKANIWFLEISLPFKTFNVDTKEDFIWRVSLNRSICSEGFLTSWCNPGNELGGYHSPGYFAYLIFGKPNTELYKKLMKEKK